MAEREVVFLVQESPEGGYEARPLGYSVFTEADTLEELKEMVRDAVRCHFDEGRAREPVRYRLEAGPPAGRRQE